MTARVRPGPSGDHYYPGVNAECSISGFCYQHDLHPDFIPVPARKVDEWQRLKEVKELVEDLPKYQLSFRRGQYFPGRFTGDTHLSHTYFWAAGCFPTHNPQAGLNWYNPNYAHGPEHAEKMHGRKYHVRNAMELPMVSCTEIAERFGLSQKTLWQWLYRHNMHFRKRQLNSRRRIGRSILTSAKWADYSVRELCKRIPNRCMSTVEDWCYMLARQDGWEAPDPPKFMKWYR